MFRRDFVSKGDDEEKPSKTGWFVSVGLAAFILFVLWLQPSCSGSPSSSHHSSSSYSSNTKSSSGWDAAVEEASHYHYDSAGHIYRD